MGHPEAEVSKRPGMVRPFDDTVMVQVYGLWDDLVKIEDEIVGLMW